MIGLLRGAVVLRTGEGEVIIDVAGVGYRVAVTGLGAISCAGVGVEALWSALLKDTAPPSKRIAPFDATHIGGPKELRRLDPFSLYALMAVVICFGAVALMTRAKE